MYLFEIVGIPKPQKQTRMANGIWYDPSKKDKEFIQWQIKPLAPSEPLECAIEMHLIFFLPIPTSTSKAMRRQMLTETALPKKKPDFDNLAYLVTNALKGIVYKDDSYVTDCWIRKRYSDRPRTVIKIITLDELTPVGGTRCA